jgi:hypothetical protein
MDGELGKNIAVFRHIANAHVRNVEWFALNQVLPVERHGAVAIDQAHDGLGSGGSARPIATEQSDDLTLRNVEADTLQDMAFAVVSV